MHTIPSSENGEFKAMAQGRCDYVVAVIHTNADKFGDMMTICATDEAVYITREQAVAFFGLIDPRAAHNR